MIKKIVIRDVASYDHEGVTFDNLAKVNFIYGGNGTGKTTFSRVLASKQPSKDFPNCCIEWDGRYQEIEVYNQDFKRRTLLEEMPGIFTLGLDEYGHYQQSSRLSYIRYQMELKKDNPLAIHQLELELQEAMLSQENFSVMTAVDNINETLERIGFTSFKIKKALVNKYCYQIVRKNHKPVGTTLSEGEVTIITFLYFLQILEGLSRGANPYGKKVLVIDDPISSLDYDALEVVSTLTNELMDKSRNNNGRVEQLFLLTHNTTFHQSLSVRQPHDDTRYWKLLKNNDGVSRLMDCGSANPVRGDYEDLWFNLRKAAEENNIIVMPNLMRRIIETYFVDYGGYDRNLLFAGKYVKSKDDKAAVVTLAKWFDEGSHAVNDNLYSGDAEMLCERYMQSFARFFTLMGQSAHYRMMFRHD